MDHNSPNSSDLLDFPGRDQILANLLAGQREPEENNTREQDEQVPRKKPKMFKVQPNSDILSRVQAFLPQMQQANQSLERADPAALDIENVDEDEEQYIEMNLGLGVLEEKKKKGTGSSSDSSDNEDENDAEDDIIIPSGSKPASKPNIQLLNEEKAKDEDGQEKE
ncbi:hypothetical protein BCR43DRAFT_489686 [Syncephalastrum racemosum]|uniref:Uncharacterized protein n=1 Tax=Syncephalastrum racemosum TaxID=13706 RepID=A0A1X2HG01_SYNRA|nr:hypothetical protein BCR43DRAFT_489686 [Syncephalastrum racemosum]